jgi:predicted Ser/Thr protein kinase
VTASPYLAPGTLLKGRYEIVSEIGRGGSSVVYRAHDRDLDGDVAIKLLVPPPATAQVARERMRREVQAARTLSHANIVAVHDFLEQAPWSFIVMELVSGEDLQVAVREHGPLDPARAIALGREIADALAAAHRRGILHRDVKPQNILLGPDQRARLTDFGSARLDSQATMTQTGGLVGTLAYAPPEMLAGERGDARSDVYALGITLYYALTGRLPERSSPQLPAAPSAAGYHPRALRPDLPTWLDDVIARATAPVPAQRFPSAASLADALRQAQAPAGATPPLPAQFCVVCGAPDPLGMIICPRCGGARADRADTLVFLAPAGASQVAVIGERLGSVIAAEGPPAELERVAAGHRPLVRVPAALGARVVERLAAWGLPARAVPARRPWSALPGSFLLLLGATAGVGGVAGAVALPALLWTTPLVILLLVGGAHQVLGRPLLLPRRQRAPLPPAVEAVVVQALTELPPGTARDLLADVVRLGRGLVIAAARGDGAPSLPPLVHQLLAAAAGVAVALGELEQNLRTLDAQRERWPTLSARWLDGVTECERTRDALVQQLLEVLSVLGELHGKSADLLRAAGPDLAALGRELELDLAAHGAAARELAELLEP